MFLNDRTFQIASEEEVLYNGFSWRKCEDEGEFQRSSPGWLIFDSQSRRDGSGTKPIKRGVRSIRLYAHRHLWRKCTGQRGCLAQSEGRVNLGISPRWATSLSNRCTAFQDSPSGQGPQSRVSKCTYLLRFGHMSGAKLTEELLIDNRWFGNRWKRFSRELVCKQICVKCIMHTSNWDTLWSTVETCSAPVSHIFGGFLITFSDDYITHNASKRSSAFSWKQIKTKKNPKK